MKRKVYFVSLILLLVFCLTACGASKGVQTADSAMSEAYASDAAETAEEYASDDYYEFGDYDNTAVSDEPSAYDSGGTSVEDTAGAGSYTPSEVKLIKTAYLEAETTDFDTAVRSIEQLVTSMGGYFENSNTYTGGYQESARSVDYTIRVPAEQYDLFLEAISGADICRVTHTSKTTTDVGMEYFDLETRLSTQQTKLERLQELLSNATAMEDIITIESAIADVEYYIESYTSELNRYDSLIGYSTIDLYLNEVVRFTEDTGETLGLGDRVSAAFRTGIADFKDGCADFVVYAAQHFISMLLSLLIVIAAAIAVVTVLRREKRRKAALKRNSAEDAMLPPAEEQNSQKE